jgi:hypothetical protein
LRELFAEYVLELLSSKPGEKIEFYFPSDKEEWNTSDKKIYRVVVGWKVKLDPMPTRITTLSHLPLPLSKSVTSVDLRPLAYV